ncbi:MAG: hypothetical protein ACXABU_03690 [Candidatus Hodarchaeales archaeon]|jgi:hypothetical protein
MAYLTSEILEQYLSCPRYFYLYKIRNIRLTEESSWSLVENAYNDIKRVSSQYFSILAAILDIQTENTFSDFKKIREKLPLDYSCIKHTPIQLTSGENFTPKVYMFLNFILQSICQESEKRGKKKRYPISISFLPQTKVLKNLIRESPTALIQYSDNKIVAIIQNYSLPRDNEDKSQTNIFSLCLVNLYPSDLTRIISIDYRSMKISFNSISSYNSRTFKPKLDVIIKKFQSHEFRPKESNSCSKCEFKLVCEHSEGVINNG